MSGTYTQQDQDNYYGGILDSLANANEIKVQQKLQWAEALTQGCCEQSNKYQVFDASTDQLIFCVQEDSECMNRCCCAPHHTFSLNLIAPSQGGNQNWGRENFISPVLFDREGCCSKCLGCWACNESCQNIAHVWKDAGAGKQHFRMEEKACNGCAPEIVIYAVGGGASGEDWPMALLSGPACFGGCYELCSDFYYKVSTIDEKTLQASGDADIATIRKIRPRDCVGMITECCTDVDNFTLSFESEYAYNRDPNFKACVLSALFYLDYMFFEMDNGVCYCSDNTLYITLFNCYCSGCICSCCIALSGNQ